MISYLDTQVVAWIGKGQLKSLSNDAKRVLDRADLLISPMVVLELEYLYELNRIKRPSLEVIAKIGRELGVRICDLSFSSVATSAISEKWTRDPFDRVIVAHAKANGFSALISADQQIAIHYPKTILVA